MIESTHLCCCHLRLWGKWKWPCCRFNSNNNTTWTLLDRKFSFPRESYPKHAAVQKLKQVTCGAATNNRVEYISEYLWVVGTPIYLRTPSWALRKTLKAQTTTGWIDKIIYWLIKRKTIVSCSLSDKSEFQTWVISCNATVMTFNDFPSHKWQRSLDCLCCTHPGSHAALGLHILRLEATTWSFTALHRA